MAEAKWTVMVLMGANNIADHEQDLSTFADDDLEEMKAEVTLKVIARGDHSLAVRGKPPSDTYAELAELATAFIAPTA